MKGFYLGKCEIARALEGASRGSRGFKGLPGEEKKREEAEGSGKELRGVEGSG